jgi:hypothetical protein
MIMKESALKLQAHDSPVPLAPRSESRGRWTKPPSSYKPTTRPFRSRRDGTGKIGSLGGHANGNVGELDSSSTVSLHNY